MLRFAPVTLESHGFRLEPLSHDHAEGLRDAASDGRLWELRFTWVPEPENVTASIDAALEAQRLALVGAASGGMLPWAVRELATGDIIGSTRYHDIIPAAKRLEIGYTWYAKRWQRTHVNTACKLMLLSHAFDTLGCGVVGLRTDILNTVSQRAIERLGAKKDGVIRHHASRKDGSIRDTVMYSILAEEWPGVRARLQKRLQSTRA